MLGSDALRKILYLEDPTRSNALTSSDSAGKIALRYATCYDGPVLGSVGFETASAIQPRSMYMQSWLVMGASTFCCLSMRARNKEKWWLGLFAVNMVFFNAVKAHKVSNGVVGHQSGFIGDVMLMIGFLGRIMARSGSFRSNVAWLTFSGCMAWYDLGRFHLWMDYLANLRREVTPERSYDLFAEFSPKDIPLEFLSFRKATLRE
jgi:hypothetical protein